MILLSLLYPTLMTTDADSLRKFNIEEAIVVASPKETRQLRQQPVSVSLFDATSLKNRKVDALKDLSSLAPNFFMPNYGSRLTSACYIRGIGSRINTPAVGLYVDNVPYVDKSAYDFSFQGIERVMSYVAHKVHSMGVTPWADCSVSLRPIQLPITALT